MNLNKTVNEVYLDSFKLLKYRKREEVYRSYKSY